MPNMPSAVTALARSRAPCRAGALARILRLDVVGEDVRLGADEVDAVNVDGTRLHAFSR